MYVLLLLLGVCFFFIFFLFSKVPDFEWYFVWSLFLEANLYILFSLICCIFVYQHSYIWSKKNTDPLFKKITPSWGEIQEFLIDFFGKYIYYIAGFLFYTAIFLISRWFFPWIDIAYIILFSNSIVVFLYIFQNKIWMGKDLIIVNLVIVSLYYIWEHILYFCGFSQIFSSIDIINIFIVFVFFSITLFNQDYQKYKKLIEQYFLVFLFLEISVFHKWFFDADIYSLGIIAWLLGSILLIFTDEIKKYCIISKYTSRTWGLLFWSFWVVMYGIALFFSSMSPWLYTLLIIWISILMFLFHKRLYSYFALSIWSLWILTSSYFLYDLFLGNILWLSYIFLLYFWLSIFFMYILRKIQTPYDFDRYFFRIISVLVNILWVITFLFFNEISILNLGLLLLWESLYLFFIYYSLRKNHF